MALGLAGVAGWGVRALGMRRRGLPDTESAQATADWLDLSGVDVERDDLAPLGRRVKAGRWMLAIGCVAVAEVVLLTVGPDTVSVGERITYALLAGALGQEFVWRCWKEFVEARKAFAWMSAWDAAAADHPRRQ